MEMVLILTPSHPMREEKMRIHLTGGDIVTVGYKRQWCRGWGATYTAEISVKDSYGNEFAKGYASDMSHPDPRIIVEVSDGEDRRLSTGTYRMMDGDLVAV